MNFHLQFPSTPLYLYLESQYSNDQILLGIYFLIFRALYHFRTLCKRCFSIFIWHYYAFRRSFPITKYIYMYPICYNYSITGDSLH